MIKRWKPANRKAPPKLKHADAFRARRRALSQLFPGETLVIPTGHEKVRANDTYYRFRPGTDFYYLTGNIEPDCVLVLQPKEGGGHTDILFVEPNPGRSDATFFTDRVKGELWVGPRLGVKESQARFGVDEARGLPELKGLLDGLHGAVARPTRVLRGFSPQGGRARCPPRPSATRRWRRRSRRCGCSRTRRSCASCRRAIDSTQRGFEDVIAQPEDGEERARGGGRLQPARPRGGQRRRLRHHRRQRLARVRAALDAQRRRR